MQRHEMYENDPDRLNRPPIGEPVETSSLGIVVAVLFAALAIMLAYTFWPGDNTTGTTMTENTPRVERPPTTAAPANKPAPTQAPTPAPTPAPAPPQQ